MKITDLMPIGALKDGCAILQAPNEQTVRTVFWTSEMPEHERNRPKPAHGHYISNITEESCDVMDFPEPMCQALGEVLTEIMGSPELLTKWKPGSFNRMLRRATTAQNLKDVATKDDFLKALKTKSRLGIWLERGEP